MATQPSRMRNDYAERAQALNEAARQLADSLLGCWQHELSRPFAFNGKTYRVCLKCGMMRDLQLKAGRSAARTNSRTRSQIYMAA